MICYSRSFVGSSRSPERRGHPSQMEGQSKAIRARRAQQDFTRLDGFLTASDWSRLRESQSNRDRLAFLCNVLHQRLELRLPTEQTYAEPVCSPSCSNVFITHAVQLQPSIAAEQCAEYSAQVVKKRLQIRLPFCVNSPKASWDMIVGYFWAKI